MNDRFKNDCDRALSDLTWSEGDARRTLQAIGEERPKMTRKLKWSLALALLLVLAAAVALAITLNQSASYTATQRARQALMDKYDLTVEMLPLFDEQLTEKDGVSTIRFYTYHTSFTNPETMGEYTVTVDEKGNVNAVWSHDDADPATWRDGDLTSPVWGAPQIAEMQEKYKIYQEWFFRDDKYALPLEQQQALYDEMSAKIAPLVYESGDPSAHQQHDEELQAEWARQEADWEAQHGKIVSADEGALTDSERRLMEAARTAAGERFGLTDETLWLFMQTIKQNEQDDMVVSFMPWDSMYWPADIDWRWYGMYSEQLGAYTLVMDAQGAVKDASWSLEGTEDDSAYDQSNWGAAKAYSARMLPWAVELLKANQPLDAKYQDNQTDWFSVEDAAAYDQRYRDAGYDAKRYKHALPKESDITAEEARTLGKQAMKEAYSLTDEFVNSYTLTTEYTLEDGGTWWVGFYGNDGMGFVKLRAADGEVQRVGLDSGATGNG